MVLTSQLLLWTELPEDSLYPPLLIGMMFFGLWMRSIVETKRKKTLIIATGVFLMPIFFGLKGLLLRPALLVAVNYGVVVGTSKKYCHVISLVFSFGYVMGLRFWESWKEQESSAICSNILLFLLLRVVSLSFDVHLSHYPSRSNKGFVDVAVMKPFVPSLLDYLAYVTCAVGAPSGPFYRFATFKDMLHLDEEIASLGDRRTTFQSTMHASVRSYFVREFLKMVPLVLFLLVFIYMGIEYDFMLSDEFLNRKSLFYRLFYLFLVFTKYRFRLTIGLKLGTLSCVACGLGCYASEMKPISGLGKSLNLTWSDVKSATNISFNAVQSMEYREAEMTCRVNEGIRNWNKSVQWWFSYYIYRDFPIRNRMVRMVMTFIFSGLWHGISPGYYLCFLMAPPVILMQGYMDVVMLPLLSLKNRRIYDAFMWFYTYRAYEYYAVGPIMLSFRNCFLIWRSCYFYFHLILLTIPVFVLMGRLQKNKLTRNA